ncbi:2TM domain-containing protein [Seonamhaeicola maritimus]|uniref:2TM domain-containing protein n=1 Tax=Seonamhaeicola maritimus TaxID=2591822 RepID=A0A5C7GM73_9FLAO|nr:2TM domain-containing protein [Seonamhaeicola maritimus]TXG39157.1 2TM domain-containing protein [Seonamhaeicola maritimus]
MEQDKNKGYFKAKEKVRHIKMFYYHLVLFIVVLILLSINFLYLDENNPYSEFFILFNSIIIVVWTVVIILHGRWALKGKSIFKKGWEDQKMKEYLEKEEEETTLWE